MNRLNEYPDAGYPTDVVVGENAAISALQPVETMRWRPYLDPYPAMVTAMEAGKR